MPTITVISHIIAKHLGTDSTEISFLSSLADIGIDSLDLIQIVLRCEESFQITLPDHVTATIRTVADLHDAVMTARTPATARTSTHVR